jgi:hypothetical protein
MAWYLNRALTTFRNEVNQAFPNRDKTSDGTIGDAAHQASTSDHNPDADGSVDAWDMDVDLRSGADAENIEKLKKLFQAHPAARYWIHDRQIAHRSDGWRRKYYSGANPHDKHVHWNSESAYEDSTRPWGVEGIVDMPLDNDDVMKIWTWDLVDGDGREVAYKMLKRSADDATAAKTAAKLVAADTTALRTEVASLKAAVEAIAPAEPTVVTDEQLERVLRKVVGSVDGVS